MRVDLTPISLSSIEDKKMLERNHRESVGGEPE
jgi:hypothetical protein